MRTRIATAAIALPVLLAVLIFASNAFFSLFIGALTLCGLYEVCTMSARQHPARFIAAFGIGGALAAWLLVSGDEPWWMSGAVITVMLALTAWVAVSPSKSLRNHAGLTLLGSLYVGLLFPCFAMLRNKPGGIAMILLMLLLVIAGDSAAYFAGTYFGRRKLVPKVSPGKTLEGSAASLGAAVLAAFALRPWLATGVTAMRLLFFAVILNLAAQAGDLAESAFKRAAGVKDSGWFFPGHGGLLDRADSLVFAAAFAYYYIR